MKYIFIILFFGSCISAKPSNAIEELAGDVIKRKEGIDIRLTPIEPEKK